MICCDYFELGQGTIEFLEQIAALAIINADKTSLTSTFHLFKSLVKFDDF